MDPTKSSMSRPVGLPETLPGAHISIIINQGQVPKPWGFEVNAGVTTDPYYSRAAFA